MRIISRLLISDAGAGNGPATETKAQFSPELEKTITAYVKANSGKATAKIIEKSVREGAVSELAKGQTEAQIIADLKLEMPADAPPIVAAAEKGSLIKALKAAQDGLAHALRSLIANGVPDGAPERNHIETAFETVKNAATDPAPEHLATAQTALKMASDMLANRTLKEPADLTVVREAHAATTTAVNRHKK